MGLFAGERERRKMEWENGDGFLLEKREKERREKDGGFFKALKGFGSSKRKKRSARQRRHVIGPFLPGGAAAAPPLNSQLPTGLPPTSPSTVSFLSEMGSWGINEMLT